MHAGFFGAAWFGYAAYDVSNVLENDMGGNGKAQGALNVAYTLYLVSATCREIDWVVHLQILMLSCLRNSISSTSRI